jgi:hypothetical protein
MSTDPWDKHGGPAYPITAGETTYKGMTLRDHFAGQALVGICGNFSSDPSVAADLLSGAEKDGISPIVLLARFCYTYADAMLLVRDKA